MVMGEMVEETEVLVIGAGPGGYVAALRAAQLGKKVMLVDKGLLGGVCLNEGCIPSKALIHASDVRLLMEEAGQMGLSAGKVKVDAKQLQKWKDMIVSDLVQGIEQLCKKAGVEIRYGMATFESSRRVKVSGKESATIEFDACIIATGSQVAELPGIKIDGTFVISSKEALELKDIPKQFVVIGGGYIGLEMGVAYAKLGSSVTVIEHGTRLMKNMAEDVSKAIADRIQQLNISVIYNAEAKKASHGSVTVSVAGKLKKLKADKVLVAVGRKPLTQLGLSRTKVKLDKNGFIQVNEKMQTDDPNIYAIGDVVGHPMLAHKASRQGKIAAEVIAGRPSAYDNACCPAVMFTDPELAYCGMDETEAKENGFDVIVGKFPFSALGKAFAVNKKHGFVKVIVDKKTDLVLGCQIVGGNASDMISEIALAIEMGATREDIAATIHPHPTFPEAIAEAAEAAKNEAVHIFQK